MKQPTTSDADRTGAQAAGIPAEHLDQIVERFNRGIGLMDQQKAAEAAREFEQVVRLAPNWATGRVNLGIALLNAQGSENLARAEAELNKAIELDDDNCYAHYSLGVLYMHLARFEEARVQFEHVLRLDPQDADAHYQLGVLVMDQDPKAAQRHLEHTLQEIPHHASACYQLHTMLRAAGETKQADELLAQFRRLRDSGVGVYFGMKYGAMGRYADLIRMWEHPGARATSDPGAPGLRFEDAAERAGLVVAAAGKAGWPGAEPVGDVAFGPGVAAADVDGDGDLDLYLSGLGVDGAGILYRNEQGRFTEVQNTSIDGRGAIGAYFGDCDRDGDPDLYLTCAGANRLYRNDGGMRFSDATASTGTAGGPFLSVGAAWADADHDGDLDLYVANFARLNSDGTFDLGAPNALWRNNGDGTFTDVAVAAGIDGGDAATCGVAFFDFDDDRDLDLYVLNARGPSRIFFNERVGRYSEATERFPELANVGHALGALLGDVDGNGREDLLVLRGKEPPRLFLQKRRGNFSEDTALAAIAQELGGAVSGVLGDLDLDGDLDLVLFNVGRGHETRHYILVNQEAGRFATPVTFGGPSGPPDARGAIAADLDGDGGLELVVGRVAARPQLWRAPAPADRHWLVVIPGKTGDDRIRRIEPGAVGLRIEVKSGWKLQTASLTSSSGYLSSPPPLAHFGLSGSGKSDYVRLGWPDAVFQSELEVAADQAWQVGKVERKASSCPILFSWDGDRFAFVTDFLGGGGLGFFIAPGNYALPDPTEDVRIPPGLIRARDGKYLLRVVEPLEELAYVDQLHLRVYDHPESLEVYPDERFAIAPPFASGRPIVVAEKFFPTAARTSRDKDVLDSIRGIDRRYVKPPLDRRFPGYADDHWIELDFGQQFRGLDAHTRLALCLYGWVEYTYSHVNYAAHQAGLTMRPPSLEVPDGTGGWRPVAEIGYPAGLPRMMTFDISSLPVRDDGRLRLRTNMALFWDQIFVARAVAGPELRVHTLEPSVAMLRPLGYPREYSPDGFDPLLYDYGRIDQGIAFKNMTGHFTRFGDVRALLLDADDRFVIMGRGEEIALEFDATGLPEIPSGWSRTVVLHSDGYCKDMDLYTAYSDRVEPLPYHEMKGYPPDEQSEQSQEQQEYQRAWNTRRVTGQ